MSAETSAMNYASVLAETAATLQDHRERRIRNKSPAVQTANRKVATAVVALSEAVVALVQSVGDEAGAADGDG